MEREPEGEIGRIITAVVEGAPHIRLIGECDLFTAPELTTHLRSLMRSGARRIIFDLEHTTFLDSSILQIFLTAHRHSAATGGEVVLLCRPGFVHRLLHLLEMNRLIRVCTPEEWRRQTAAVH